MAWPPDSGPAGLQLRYAAGGVGGLGFPGSTSWSVALGRNWSHDLAMRIVSDSVDHSHVWLLTPRGTFREYTDTNLDGTYDHVSPSDAYATLVHTDPGWELRELDGTTHFYDGSGRWAETADSNGNLTSACYGSLGSCTDAGALLRVSFPDQRRLDFDYYGGADPREGKLREVTEVGIDELTGRSWLYDWSGSDLIAIERPDGTAVALSYEDSRHPGFLTRMMTLPVAESPPLDPRLEIAWKYDSGGNVVAQWKGSYALDGSGRPEPDAGSVMEWSFSFVDIEPSGRPKVTAVTDALGSTSTYHFSRDTSSEKPRIDKIEGDCPSCGLAPDSELFYEDSDHPLRPTRIVEAEGTPKEGTTVFTYGAQGQMTSRTEASGSALERTTTWEYDPTYPALRTLEERPSTSGTGSRKLIMGYDSSGNMDSRKIEGIEAGAPFSLETVMSYNSAGMVLTIDPPGFGTADVTTFTYDPDRGHLVPLTREDPLVGTTTFHYDDLNRRTGVTDPNGVRLDTEYDDLDRVRFVRHRADLPADDLVTEHVYSAYGDLFRTILPEGNMIEYGYDEAGRLISIERKPDASTPGERTFFALDGAGNRIREDLQRWDSGIPDWVTESFTEYEYSTPCHLDKVIHADSTVTEYAYDCHGNVEKVWDANNPSNGQTEPASLLYTYDELDRLTSVTQPWGGTGGGSIVTEYEYDVQDHLIKVIDPNGNETTYVYSDRDLMTKETSPVSGETTFAYNEHGELELRVDERGVEEVRTIDPLGRVTEVTYGDPTPDPDLTVTYTYDVEPSCFGKGRMMAVARGIEAIAYCYDRFGRLLHESRMLGQSLSYSYDRNGNRIGLQFVTGVAATYEFDYADREITLEVNDGSSPILIVEEADYYSFGPLRRVKLENGLEEIRDHTSRYFTDRIRLLQGGHVALDWQYTNDAVGNVTAITISGGTSRSFGYQPHQYFLTSASGAWGSREWTYDPIGSRLTEIRDAVTDTYAYVQQGSVQTPILDYVSLGGGGTRDYMYGPAGHLEEVALPSVDSELEVDLTGRIGRMSTTVDNRTNTVAAIYDGRGFLDRIMIPLQQQQMLATREEFMPCVGNCPPQIRAAYSADGVLHHFVRTNQQGAVTDEAYALYFAGRPIAQRRQISQGGWSWLYLATDHLGGPIAASNDSGTVVWDDGLGPFGEDVGGAAAAAGVFLRLPGQWQHDFWASATEAVPLFDNVHRWYEPQTGRYTRPDPLGREGDPHLYLYAAANPLKYVDVDGQRYWPPPAGGFVQNYSRCPVLAYGDPGPFSAERPVVVPRARFFVRSVPIIVGLSPRLGDMDFVCLGGTWIKTCSATWITANRRLRTICPPNRVRPANADELAILPPCEDPPCDC